jgi:hypothetical protein
MKERDDVERRMDLAAELALRARERVEAAIDAGNVPAWVLDACSVIEKASVQYGELAEQLRRDAPLAVASEPTVEAEPLEPVIRLQSLTVH